MVFTRLAEVAVEVFAPLRRFTCAKVAREKLHVDERGDEGVIFFDRGEVRHVGGADAPEGVMNVTEIFDNNLIISLAFL